MSEIMGHKMLHSWFDFLVIGCRSDLFNSSLNSFIVNSWKWCLRFEAKREHRNIYVLVAYCISIYLLEYIVSRFSLVCGLLGFSVHKLVFVRDKGGRRVRIVVIWNFICTERVCYWKRTMQSLNSAVLCSQCEMLSCGLEISYFWRRWSSWGILLRWILLLKTNGGIIDLTPYFHIFNF